MNITLPTATGPAPVELFETDAGFTAVALDAQITATAKTRPAALLALGRRAFKQRAALGLVGRARLDVMRSVLARLDTLLLVDQGCSYNEALALRVTLRALGCQARVKEGPRGWHEELERHARAVALYVENSHVAGPLGRPGVRYRVWLADPPWLFSDSGTRIAPHYEGEQRSSKRYDALPLPEIMALGEQIRACSEPDALLFLWVPAALVALDYHGKVARAWGFEPKTLVPWVKTRRDGEGLAIGAGHYTRTAHEELVVATRGALDVAVVGTPSGDRLVIASRGRGSSLVTRHDVPGVIRAPRRAHSQKPDEQYSLIESLLGDVPRIELFSRKPRVGWDSWGAEATSAEAAGVEAAGVEAPGANVGEMEVQP